MLNLDDNKEVILPFNPNVYKHLHFWGEHQNQFA